MTGPRSRDAFARARRVLPGGVSSPVRAFSAVGGEPLVLESGQGATVRDVDGNSYLDFVGSFGPLILGHAAPPVVEAIRSAALSGTTFGAPCAAEIDLAERVVESYPGIEQVRFVSSGTEAAMSAVRLARGATDRELIVKFSGCYHGHVDHMLVAAGSGLATFGRPSSAGVPEAFANRTRVLPLDDPGLLSELMRREGDGIAAVIVEPLPANHGLLPQRDGFLRALRAETDRSGALLIFDEVITGFRLGPGGMAVRSGVTPDLVCFGKVIGGGMPVGAFAGRSELMRHLAPEGPVYQAGTLSGNPVAMAAGLATLKTLEAEDGWARLEALGAELERRVGEVLASAPLPASLTRVGSLFWVALQDGESPRAAGAIEPEGARTYEKLFSGLLSRGIYAAPSYYEVGFLSLAHSQQDVERLAGALAEAAADLDQAAP
ncbi:MAG: glutamate-1-semialdehyde 2,1-aminomutase [Acidobacteriota bacterium]|nr:glutamate-1-semialdehyde 2,1-aminomutase [Acidobacteriota bacterium]